MEKIKRKIDNKKALCFIFSGLIFAFQIHAQLPSHVPKKANVKCNSIKGVLETSLADKDGLSLEYSNNICEVYFGGKLYTGIAKSCKDNVIVSITNYKNGLIEGENYFYKNSGFIDFYIMYGKNTKNIISGYDEPNHKEIAYCNGIANGIEVHFRDNGIVWFEGNNIDDKRDGKWTFYDNKGAVNEVRIYKDGALIKCSGECK
jgi:antitoxin component YwqK of YwqJK toxin-antitoxin module